MTDATDRGEDDVALAGEYVLRLMDQETRLLFERRLEREPTLRVLVREWDEGLVALTDDVAPEAPPRNVKSQVEVRLFGPKAAARSNAWTWGGFLSGALAATVVVIAVVFMLGSPSPGPTLISEIAAEDRSVVYSARFDASSGALAIDRLEGAPAAGRVHELWLIPEGTPVPVSLGVVPDGGQARISLPASLAAALAGGTLAVSDEPPGGSPTGQPTGAVLATGGVDAV